MRTAFINGLMDLAEKDEKVVLIVGDLGYSVVEVFSDRFPNRFYNAGIAEQNMMSMAAGLASEGFRVFVYSIANFPTFRCAEQIRNDVAYHGLPVTVVSVGGGLVYGSSGYSHHAVQDYALIRSMPGMKIFAPGDPLEVQMCLELISQDSGPSYLRIGAPGTPNVHTATPSNIEGDWLFVSGNRESKKILLSTGGTLAQAASWLSLPEYADYALYSLPVWGSDLKNCQTIKFSDLEALTTIEDHLLDGGFGSWVLESALISEPEFCSKITIKALNPEVTKLVAKESQLREAGGLVP